MTDDIPQGNATYDAATANMGYPWKMPTKDQCQELIDNTTTQWTTINGVNGYKFTSNSDSTKYIFLPAAGGWWDETFNRSPNSYGYYWSSGYYTAVQNSDWAYYMNFYSKNVYTSYTNRYSGFSIRPIRPLKF